MEVKPVGMSRRRRQLAPVKVAASVFYVRARDESRDLGNQVIKPPLLELPHSASPRFNARSWDGIPAADADAAAETSAVPEHLHIGLTSNCQSIRDTSPKRAPTARPRQTQLRLQRFKRKLSQGTETTFFTLWEEPNISVALRAETPPAPSPGLWRPSRTHANPQTCAVSPCSPSDSLPRPKTCATSLETRRSDQLQPSPRSTLFDVPCLSCTMVSHLGGKRALSGALPWLRRGGAL